MTDKLSDDRLRQLRDDDIVCVQDWVRSMAAELLAARARITELEAEVQADERAIEEARDERDAARDRAAELEAAPVAELIGYAVLGHSTEILGDQNLTREWTEERAQWWRDRGWDARVVELREVTDRA